MGTDDMKKLNAQARKVLIGMMLFILLFVAFDSGISSLATHGWIAPESGVKLLFVAHMTGLVAIVACAWWFIRAEKKWKISTARA